MSAEVIRIVPPPAGGMSEAEYDAERDQLRELYGDTSKEAGAKADQALARLFFRSGWTQEKLAAKEGKSQRYISNRLCFGRFLGFSATALNADLPPNLTERAFRKVWERTEKDSNERARFQAVLRLMAESTPRLPQRPKIGGEIVKRFADGKWHRVDAIAKRIDADVNHVRDTLDNMRTLGSFGATAERKPVSTPTYRIFRTDKTLIISSQELREKLESIIETIDEQGRRNAATISFGTLVRAAHDLRTLLDEWTK